VRSHYARWHS